MKAIPPLLVPSPLLDTLIVFEVAPAIVPLAVRLPEILIAPLLVELTLIDPACLVASPELVVTLASERVPVPAASNSLAVKLPPLAAAADVSTLPIDIEPEATLFAALRSTFRPDALIAFVPPRILLPAFTVREAPLAVIVPLPALSVTLPLVAAYVLPVRVKPLPAPVDCRSRLLVAVTATLDSVPPVDKTS